MSLGELQRRIQRVCVTVEVDPKDIEPLGNTRVWGIYREMVRRRLYGELKVVFPRSYRDAGEQEFRLRFESLLEAAPPTVRRFADVPLWFARAVVPLWRDDAARPAHLGDLLAYEALRWEVSDLIGDVTGDVVEFGFDAVPVFSPTLRLITLEHAVHREPSESGGYEAGRCYMAVCRSADDAPVKAWKLNRSMFELMTLLEDGQVTVTEAVRSVAQRTGVELTQKFIEDLCGALANFIERGVIVGSR